MMIADIIYRQKKIKVNLSKPIDISIPLRADTENVNAYNAPPVRIEPVVSGNFIGEVSKGSPVNFRNIFFNPHGNGTHTECVGHISSGDFSINRCLSRFFFIAELISVVPEEQKGDQMITKNQITEALGRTRPEALIIRTLPNDKKKITRNYSGKNPPYLHHLAAQWIASVNIEHLLIDLPSVDKERDGGKLLAHRNFWNFPEKVRENATITELIYVPDDIKDGSYLLNLTFASFENDASPAKPVIYRIMGC